MQARKGRLSSEPPNLPCNVRLIGSELRDCHQKAPLEAYGPESQQEQQEQLQQQKQSSLSLAYEETVLTLSPPSTSAHELELTVFPSPFEASSGGAIFEPGEHAHCACSLVNRNGLLMLAVHCSPCWVRCLVRQWLMAVAACTKPESTVMAFGLPLLPVLRGPWHAVGT